VTLSFLQVVIIILAIVLLFGRHRISDMMKDVAKGMKAFKEEIEPDNAASHDKRPTLKKQAQQDVKAALHQDQQELTSPPAPSVKTAKTLVKAAPKKTPAAKKPAANKASVKKPVVVKAAGTVKAGKPAPSKNVSAPKKAGAPKPSVKK
jgi:TatA/E family protein of Tat protein translocase